MKLLVIAALVSAAASTAALAQPSSNSINFDSMSLGNPPGVGGPDIRVPGDSNWYNPSNSSTQQAVTAGVGRFGTNGLVVGNNGSGNDGVIDNLRTPRLLTNAGESVGPVNSTNNLFQWSLWFRTVPTSNPNGTFRFRVESYGPDRTTFLGFQQDGSGNLIARAFGMNSSANFVSQDITGLNWGDWYRVTGALTFADGAANDSISYSIFTSANVLVGSATTPSWEEGARQLGYNGGNIFGVDALQFHSRGGSAGDHAIVDDISYAALTIPLPPAAWAGIGSLAGVAAFGMIRRRKLAAE